MQCTVNPHKLDLCTMDLDYIHIQRKILVIWCVSGQHLDGYCKLDDLVYSKEWYNFVPHNLKTNAISHSCAVPPEPSFTECKRNVVSF